MSTRAQITFAITGQNQFSGSFSAENGAASVYVDGNLTGKITIQGRRAGSTGAWVDLNSVTLAAAAGVCATAVMPGGWEFRAGCKTGDYTSGSTTEAILQGSNQEGGG